MATPCYDFRVQATHGVYIQMRRLCLECASTISYGRTEFMLFVELCIRPASGPTQVNYMDLTPVTGLMECTALTAERHGHCANEQATDMHLPGFFCANSIAFPCIAYRGLTSSAKSVRPSNRQLSRVTHSLL